MWPVSLGKKLLFFSHSYPSGKVWCHFKNFPIDCSIFHKIIAWVGAKKVPHKVKNRPIWSHCTFTYTKPVLISARKAERCSHSRIAVQDRRRAKQELYLHRRPLDRRRLRSGHRTWRHRRAFDLCHRHFRRRSGHAFNHGRRPFEGRPFMQRSRRRLRGPVHANGAWKVLRHCEIQRQERQGVAILCKR